MKLLIYYYNLKCGTELMNFQRIFYKRKRASFFILKTESIKIFYKKFLLYHTQISLQHFFYTFQF
jgi:hypothetical protein